MNVKTSIKLLEFTKTKPYCASRRHGFAYFTDHIISKTKLKSL